MGIGFWHQSLHLTVPVDFPTWSDNPFENKLVLVCSSVCSQWLNFSETDTTAKQRPPLSLTTFTEKRPRVLFTEEMDSWFLHLQNMLNDLPFSFLLLNKPDMLVYQSSFETVTLHADSWSLGTVHIHTLTVTWREMLERMKVAETGLH